MEKYAGTQAVARTFQLINLFDDDKPIWSLSELVTASNLKQTTVFRLMAALEAEGIIRRTPNGDYALGSTLIVYGGRAIRANRLRSVAQPYLFNLVQSTGESVTIDILWIDENNKPNTIVIEEQLSQRLLGMTQYIGARLPAHTTSTGKVLLAFMADEALQRLNLSELSQLTEHTITTLDKLHEELAEVRTRGFAITQSELEIGLTAIAAPIFNHHQEVVAALCVAGPVSRLTPQRSIVIAGQIRATAVQISTELGVLQDFRG